MEINAIKQLVWFIFIRFLKYLDIYNQYKDDEHFVDRNYI